METIDEQTLRRFAESGVLAGVVIQRLEGNGWAIRVDAGTASYRLMSYRGNVRRYSDLDTAVRYLEGFGVKRLTIETEGVPA